MKGSDNTCICCGCLIPEGRQICPKCSSEGYCFEQVMSRPIPAQEIKEIKKLLREVLPVLRAAFFANYKNQDKADELYSKISQIVGRE